MWARSWRRYLNAPNTAWEFQVCLTTTAYISHCKPEAWPSRDVQAVSAINQDRLQIYITLTQAAPTLTTNISTASWFQICNCSTHLYCIWHKYAPRVYYSYDNIPDAYIWWWYIPVKYRHNIYVQWSTLITIHREKHKLRICLHLIVLIRITKWNYGILLTVTDLKVHRSIDVFTCFLFSYSWSSEAISTCGYCTVFEHSFHTDPMFSRETVNVVCL